MTGTLMYPSTRTVRARLAISRLASIIVSATSAPAVEEYTWEVHGFRHRGFPTRESGPVLLNREQVIKMTAEMR